MALPSDAPRLRLCKLKKWSDFAGYGFNLHAEKGKAGQFIGKVDPDSPASKGGVKENDRVVEVNGNSVISENHAQVVQRIKENGDRVDMLLVDSEAEQYYAAQGIVMSSSLPSVDEYQTPETRYEEAVIISHGHGAGNGMENGNSYSQVHAAPEPAPEPEPTLAPAPAPARVDTVDTGKMSAAELRAKIAASNRRNAAKSSPQSFKEKYDVFQSL